MSRAILAFSGGLDTSYCAVWLRESLGHEVITVTVDTGGLESADRDAIAARAEECGAARHVLVDGRARVWDECVTYLVMGNVLRGEVYPLCVGAERIVQADEVARVAETEGAGVIAHGSTGAGNDGVRFDVAFAVRRPEAEILAPIRDMSLTREQSAAYLREHGIPVPDKVTGYSVNVGLWGTTIGGRETHDSWETPPEDAYSLTADPLGAPTEPEELTIGFVRGVPVTLDGEPVDGVSLVTEINRRAATHGIGRGIHVGDTILGTKGRLAFEAPAPLVLIEAHRELEKLVLSRQQGLTKRSLAETYGNLLHEARWDDPAMRDIEAFLESSQRLVTGEARVRLRRGAFEVIGARSEHSLLGAEGGKYGETAAWTGPEARAFARIYGVSTVLAARAHRDDREQS